jgi:beta-glucanase (GH16 family)
MSRVALVLVPDFRESLKKLAFRMPVWIIETTENRLAAQDAWHMAEEWPQIDVTIFNGVPSKREEWTAQIEMIDLHSRISTLEVIGSEMTLPARAALTELGFDRFEATGEGFRAKRPR